MELVLFHTFRTMCAWVARVPVVCSILAVQLPALVYLWWCGWLHISAGIRNAYSLLHYNNRAHIRIVVMLFLESASQTNRSASKRSSMRLQPHDIRQRECRTNRCGLNGRANFIFFVHSSAPETVAKNTKALHRCSVTRWVSSSSKIVYSQAQHTIYTLNNNYYTFMDVSSMMTNILSWKVVPRECARARELRWRAEVTEWTGIVGKGVGRF